MLWTSVGQLEELVCQLARNTVAEPTHSGTVRALLSLYTAAVISLHLFTVYYCVAAKYSRIIRHISIVTTTKISFTNVSFSVFLRDFTAAVFRCQRAGEYEKEGKQWNRCFLESHFVKCMTQLFFPLKYHNPKDMFRNGWIQVTSRKETRKTNLIHK